MTDPRDTDDRQPAAGDTDDRQPAAGDFGGRETGAGDFGGRETGAGDVGGRETGAGDVGGRETGAGDFGDRQPAAGDLGGRETDAVNADFRDIDAGRARVRHVGGRETGARHVGAWETGAEDAGGRETGGRETGGRDSDAREAGAGRQRSGDRTARIAALRPAYLADLDAGTDRFLGPRRTTCPWCASGRLTPRLRTTDLLQHKPGRFALDRCADCGHVFQNPPLTAEGLEFYYRDFYDGLGEQRMNGTFGGRTAMYRGRAEAMLPHDPAPKTWLDVGTGHGHFCATARTVLPGTVFDGLDFTDGVELAAREGRVDHAYRGAFPDLAPDLAARYDVVSMFHYLEHSTDPDRELRAAHVAVRPGGHLLIEVPDPESRYARLLGRWWLPWLQPQHLHLMPVANLRRRLAGLGFTVVAEQHAEAHDPVDLLAAVWLALDHTAPREDAPWLPARPGLLRRAARTALLLAGVPALLTATLVDRFAVRPLSHRLGLSNAYRLVARKE